MRNHMAYGGKAILPRCFSQGDASLNVQMRRKYIDGIFDYAAAAFLAAAASVFSCGFQMLVVGRALGLF